jgi:hypothetical protein
VKSQKENIFGFLGYDICQTKELTPHTYVQGTTHIDALHQVDPMARLPPRILSLTNELMGQF